MKQAKIIIPHKTDKEIEKEIENICAGRDHTTRGRMLFNMYKLVRLTKSQEDTKKMFIAEYKQKYHILEKAPNKQKALNQLAKESKAAIKQATGTKV